MLWTISAILLVLWVLGLITGSTVGMWVHLLLAFGMVALVLAFVSSARPARTRTAMRR
jgi:hypothetical protein